MSSPRPFNTLSDFLSYLGYPVPDAQLTVHPLEAVSPPAPFQSEMFRANYFTFVLLRDGRSRYTLDGTAYDVRPGMLYFTNPGHLKGFELLQPVTGKLLSFTEEFMQVHVDPSPYDNYPFLLTERVRPQLLEAELFDDLWGLCDGMQAELAPDRPYAEAVAGALFRLFLLKVKRHLYAGYDPIEEGDRESAIVQRFRQVLRERIGDLVAGRAHRLPQVSDFADDQSLHPAYFATVVRSKTGKTASTWLQEAVVTAAQGLLRHSGDSVKEIAFRLGFTEPNYFSRYFRRVTGATPSAYRREG